MINNIGLFRQLAGPASSLPLSLPLVLSLSLSLPLFLPLSLLSSLSLFLKD